MFRLCNFLLLFFFSSSSSFVTAPRFISFVLLRRDLLSFLSFSLYLLLRRKRHGRFALMYGVLKDHGDKPLSEGREQEWRAPRFFFSFVFFGGKKWREFETDI